MGIVNVTPDSFSGDGCSRRRRPASTAAVAPGACAMVDEGADLLDIGGESTRPGHAPVERRGGAARVDAGGRAPSAPPSRTCRISVDTTKAAVAAAALDAGADLLNDVWGVGRRRTRMARARRRARRALRR